MLKQIHEAGKHENSISGKKNKIGGLIFGCIFLLILASAAMMANASVSMVIGWIGPALFLFCILIQKEVLPLKKNIRIILTLIGAFLIVPYFMLHHADSSIRRQKYDWDDAVMKEVLPEPSSAYGKIVANNESTLSAADDAYYIEVMGRINTELAETGLSLL